MDAKEVREAINGAPPYHIYVDSVNGIDSDGFIAGRPENPVHSLEEAKKLMEKLGLKESETEIHHIGSESIEKKKFTYEIKNHGASDEYLLENGFRLSNTIIKKKLEQLQELKLKDRMDLTKKVISLTKTEIDIIKHSLGVGRGENRNYFCTSEGSLEYPSLEKMVKMGLMIKRKDPVSTDSMYHVTEKGKDYC